MGFRGGGGRFCYVYWKLDAAEHKGRNFAGEPQREKNLRGNVAENICLRPVLCHYGLRQLS